MNIFRNISKQAVPDANSTLPGRIEVMPVPEAHFVHGRPIVGPFASHLHSVVFGMGCFWGVERRFWSLPGVYTTAAGYIGGLTPNPTYQEVCSGQTGHNEVVLVVYDPEIISLQALLQVFWEGHDPTQGMRQGNDRGTQYRSGIYLEGEEGLRQAQESMQTYQRALSDAAYGQITTEIVSAPEFYYAEEYHQQYLGKNPGGYCGLAGTGVSCAQGLNV